jgi:hypothetical protein
MSMRSGLAILSALAVAACSRAEGRPLPSASSPRSAAVAEHDGWWIKVRTEKQESPTITLSIGSNNHTVEAWRTWSSGDPAEFDVPDKFKNINPLYIKAQSSGGRNSWFCMMYKSGGVKHFDFDDDEDHEEKQSDRDGECNF